MVTERLGFLLCELPVCPCVLPAVSAPPVCGLGWPRLRLPERVVRASGFGGGEVMPRGDFTVPSTTGFSRKRSPSPSGRSLIPLSDRLLPLRLRSCISACVVCAAFCPCVSVGVIC